MRIYTYLTVNKLNGKCYVGSHLSHKDHDNYLGSGNLICSAIKKYGKNNFAKVILKEYESILAARNSEGHYISLFESLVPRGYNISPTGGCNFKDGLASEETKLKLSKFQKYRKHSEEHNNNVSKALEGRKRDPSDNIQTWKTRRMRGKTEPWNKGKTGIYLEETKKKMGIRI